MCWRISDECFSNSKIYLHNSDATHCPQPNSFLTHIIVSLYTVGPLIITYQSAPSPRASSRPRAPRRPPYSAVPVENFPRRKSQPRKRAPRRPRKLQRPVLPPLPRPRRTVGGIELHSIFPGSVREMLERIHPWKLQHMPAQVRTGSALN